MSDKKTSVFGSLGYKIRNLTDTNLLLAELLYFRAAAF